MKKNDIYQIEITDMTAEGMGVGRADGFVVFVANTFYGETVRIRIVKVKKTYAYAIVLELLVSSPFRVQSNCPSWPQCGGCQFWHVSYEGELLFKQKKVENSISRIAGLSVPVLPVVGAKTPERYRNKGQFPVGIGADGQPLCGLYAQRSHRIVPAQDCLIQDISYTPLSKALLQYMAQYGVRPYDEISGAGVIRHLYTRVSAATGEVMVTVVSTKRTLPQEETLVQLLRQAEPRVATVLLNVQSARTNVVLGEESRILFGSGYITDQILGLSFRISHRSFYQVNPAQTEVLYRKVLELACLTGRETVLDLYCGIGTISLLLAREAKMVYGAEIVPEAVQDAKENARVNGIRNAEFLLGDSGAAADELLRRGVVPDLIVVDPPRGGLSPQLVETMLTLCPPRILYVSCDPGTLARDLKTLCSDAYQATALQPVDLFPRTMHVETVVLLQQEK